MCVSYVFSPLLMWFPCFQAEISASLEGSSKKLQELREDMKDFTDSAERIRQDIKSLRFRCGVVKTAQKCEVCAEQLLQTDFYLFPCLHGFHSACLVNEVRLLWSCSSPPLYSMRPPS